MPLLATPHRQALRFLLENQGIQTFPDVQAALGLSPEQTLDALDSLRRTGLATTAPGTPGLGGVRWTITDNGLQVGPWLVLSDPIDEPEEEPKQAEPAEGWGFPWKPTAAQAPMYAEELSRRALREQAKAMRPALPNVSIESPGPYRPNLTLVILACGLTAFGAIALLWSARSVSIDVNGLQHGTAVQPSQIEGSQILFAINGGDINRAELLLDGFPVSGVQRFGGRLVWTVPPLTDGDHTVDVEVPRQLFGTASTSIDFTVDGIAPDLGIPPVYEPVSMDETILISGTAEDGVTVVIDGVPVEVVDGTFTVELPVAPAGPVDVLAIDRAGNTTAFKLRVPVAYPATQGVHVSAAAWQHDGLRTEILRLVDEGLISAVQLDLKDESGFIGYNSTISLANEIGAVDVQFNLAEAVDELHSRGVRVIGRLVAFRDPILAQHAWENGHTDWVIQTLNGEPISRYGGFTNFVIPEVQEYNLAIAREAAAAGVDDILWDYIRRPEGDITKMLIPGLGTTDPSSVIVGFLESAHQMLRSERVFQGVSVFGIAATRGDQIAQNVGAMASHVDYVAPMLYPSHWGKGEYGVENPEEQPYDIVLASLRSFQTALEGTNTPLVPWLQDFNSRVDYGPEKIADQITAAADLGVMNWLLWDPKVTYTDSGFITFTEAPDTVEAEGPPILGEGIDIRSE
jgi:hypothetical protein